MEDSGSGSGKARDALHARRPDKPKDTKEKEKEKEKDKEKGRDDDGRRKSMPRRERSKDAEKDKDKEKRKSKKERSVASRSRDSARVTKSEGVSEEAAAEQDKNKSKEKEKENYKDKVKEGFEQNEAKPPPLEDEGNTSDEAEKLGLTQEAKKDLHKQRAKERWQRYRAAEAGRDEGTALRSLVVAPEERGPVESFNMLSDDVFKHHRTLEEVARQVNTTLGAPEVVVVGFRSHGKTSLIEALIGQMVGNVGFMAEGATKRPVHYRLLNLTDAKGRPNPNTPPKCFIHYDLLLREEGSEVPLRNLPKEIARRSQQISAIPLVVILHHPFILNMTIIDTPGLIPPSFTSASEMATIPEQEALLETIAFSAAADTGRNRVVLCVEEATGWQRSAILPVARRIDPHFHRVHLVFTKFYSLLKYRLSANGEANTYLAGGKNDLIKCFWVSLPSAKVRAQCEDALSWQERIWKTHHRDQEVLRELLVKKKYWNNIGVVHLRRHVLRQVWSEGVEEAPQVLKKIRTLVTTLEREARLLDTRIKTLTAAGLRELANRYVAALILAFRRISFGSSEAEAAMYGQTSEDETLAQGGILWADTAGQSLDYERLPLAFRSCRLYGGQQIDRLLNEFRGITLRLSLPSQEVGLAELLAAAGTRRTPAGDVDLLWAACTLGARKAREILEGLLEVALRRLAYLVRRSFQIATSHVSLPAADLWFDSQHRQATDTEAPGSSATAKELGGFTFFANWIESEFETFLRTRIEDCKRRCTENFLSVSTIYWSFIEKGEPAHTQEPTLGRGQELARIVFEDLRDRLAREFLLKFYERFHLPP